MPQLIIAALILWGLYHGVRWFGRANPKAVTKGFKNAAGFAALVVAAFLLVFRGNFEVSLVLAGVGCWLLGFADAPQIFKNQRFTPGGQTRLQRFRTSTIEVEFDQRRGEAKGHALAGPFAGLQLSDLTLEQHVHFLSFCRSCDLEGARLLEIYLDSHFPGWRPARQENADPSRQNSRPRSGGAMSEDDAYEMLGLAKGASRDDITRAHRTLMKKVHPDHGGSTGLAALLNQAKDVLTRRH